VGDRHTGRLLRVLAGVLVGGALVAGGAMIRPLAASRMISVTPERQIYPLDCEAAALQIALSAENISISQDWALGQFGADLRGQVRSGNRPVRWGDPYQAFVGNVRGSFTVTGYGVYYPPIVAAAEAAGATAAGHEHWAPSQLYAEVAAGNPVIVRVPHLLAAASVGYWTAWDGRSVWYSGSDHAQVLIGADTTAGTVTLADPADGLFHTFPMALFEQRFAAFMDQAVVISMANGAPSATVTPNGAQRMVAWRGPANHLYEAVYSGRWLAPVDLTATVLGPAATLESDPSISVTPDGSAQLVFWRGPAQHLFEAWLVGGRWSGVSDLTAGYFQGEGLARSAPSSAVTPDGIQLVFWQGQFGHLDEAWYSGGRWNGPVDWTAAWFGEGALVVTGPSLAVMPNGTQLVFWTDAIGHLQEAWWAGGWNGPVDWTANRFGGAASLGSAPAAAVTPGGVDQLVFWQDLGGDLHEAWFAGGWNGPVDMSADVFGGRVSLTSSPTATVSPNGDQFLVWRSGPHTITDADFANGRWNGPVNLPFG
jgi:hypothetical protein